MLAHVIDRILKTVAQDSGPLVIQSNANLGNAEKGFYRCTKSVDLEIWRLSRWP